MHDENDQLSRKAALGIIALAAFVVLALFISQWLLTGTIL
jgi:hypothetical protein